MRERAKLTVTDVRRALKAAKAEGFDRVEIVNTPEGVKIVAERSARKADGNEIELEL